MREYRARYHRFLSVESLDEMRHVVGRKPQTAHARINLDVYWVVDISFVFAGMYHGIEQTEAIDLGFQMVVEEGLEGCHLGVHYQYVGRDSRLAQLFAFVGHSYG